MTWWVSRYKEIQRLKVLIVWLTKRIDQLEIALDQQGARSGLEWDRDKAAWRDKANHQTGAES